MKLLLVELLLYVDILTATHDATLKYSKFTTDVVYKNPACCDFFYFEFHITKLFNPSD